MPVKLVAHTGMDAMTHAIEAYVSTARSPYTDGLAIHAIEMIQENLVKSYGEDMDARDKMHDAQCMAGMAFSNGLLGIVRIVLIAQLELNAAERVDFLHGDLHRVLDRVAVDGRAAGQGAGTADLNGAVGKGGAADSGESDDHSHCHDQTHYFAHCFHVCFLLYLIMDGMKWGAASIKTAPVRVDRGGIYTERFIDFLACDSDSTML